MGTAERRRADPDFRTHRLGEWAGQTTILLRADTLTVGVIAVSEILKGSKNTAVALVVQPAPSAPRSSSDLIFQKGHRGLWLLKSRADSQGLYLVDHPQRFVALPGGTARIAQLRAKL